MELLCSAPKARVLRRRHHLSPFPSKGCVELRQVRRARREEFCTSNEAAFWVVSVGAFVGSKNVSSL